MSNYMYGDIPGLNPPEEDPLEAEGEWLLDLPLPLPNHVYVRYELRYDDVVNPLNNKITRW